MSETYAYKARDLQGKVMSGTLVARQLKASCPNTRILALTVHEDKSYLSELLEIGASGYVLKRAAAEELISAIRQVLAGGIYIDPRLGGLVANSLVRRRASTARSGATALSDRESVRSAWSPLSRRLTAFPELAANTLQSSTGDPLPNFC